MVSGSENMVGGKIIGIVRRRSYPTLFHIEVSLGKGEPASDCSFRCKETSPVLKLNDQVWWQGSSLFFERHGLTHAIEKLSFKHNGTSRWD